MQKTRGDPGQHWRDRWPAQIPAEHAPCEYPCRVERDPKRFFKPGSQGIEQSRRRGRVQTDQQGPFVLSQRRIRLFARIEALARPGLVHRHKRSDGGSQKRRSAYLEPGVKGRHDREATIGSIPPAPRRANDEGFRCERIGESGDTGQGDFLSAPT